MDLQAKQTINWKFGPKHKEYIKNCLNNNFNVAEGAVRAGKTIDNIFAFAMDLETSPDKIHLATGSTVGNAKLNIGEANGFGLEYIFRNRCRWGKFKSNECLYINTLKGERIVIFSGGMKANSFKSIRGNSYGLWIATEINLHHETFIQEAMNRSLMAERRKIYWDLNPSPPRNWIYRDYIDKFHERAKEGKFTGGFQLEKFTIFDNASLTEERKQEIIDTYDQGSIWYQRDILGKRMAVEGVIYEKYVEQPEHYLIKSEDIRNKHYSYLNIGVDFGGNKSYHTFVATGITGDNKLIGIASERHKADIDAVELSLKLVDFTKRVISHTGRVVDRVYTDSAEQVLPRDIRREFNRNGLGHIRISDSTKHPIVDRIRATDILINQDRLRVSEDAETLHIALQEAVYDESKEGEIERLDDGTSDIDTLDAFEYSWANQMYRLIRR